MGWRRREDSWAGRRGRRPDTWMGGHGRREDAQSLCCGEWRIRWGTYSLRWADTRGDECTDTGGSSRPVRCADTIWRADPFLSTHALCTSVRVDILYISMKSCSI